MTSIAKRALVTGGAGLIGSHVVDLLINNGWKVRVLDNLEPQTHRRGKPAWINEKAEFFHGDLRDRDTLTTALDKIDVVFHQAAYGGYMPEIAKFVHVNSLFTAKERASVQRMDWFFQLCVRWNNCAKAIGRCIVPSAVWARPVYPRRKTCRLVEKRSMA